MSDGEAALGFPDEARSALDRGLAELVDNAQRVLATQSRLRSLLRATRSVAEELDLETVLRTIIEEAVELVSARYGAIGVIAPDGQLEQFIHVGIPEPLAEQIGHLPEGRGLLGALIEDKAPIRLDHLRDDPRSIGFPPGHPAMDSFLGVPVRVRGDVYGNLYLTEHRSGGFTAEDQELLTALAATAGVAIDNARLFDETRRRQQWSDASAEFSAILLSDRPDDSLSFFADRVAGLAGADLVCVVLPVGEGRMVVEAARGGQAGELTGLVFAAAGTLAGRAIASEQPILLDSSGGAEDDPLVLGPAMAVPLVTTDRLSGVLIVSRDAGRHRFTETDLDMTADFAGQASLALELARGRADRQNLALLEDRGRISRDLHDHVIQRLFAAGLGLQALAKASADETVKELIAAEVTSLDAAISEIRTAIFALTGPSRGGRTSLRGRVVDLLGELGSLFVTSPRLTFAGAVDLLVPEGMADDVVAVVREGLTNVARHARATIVAVNVSVVGHVVTVSIADNGVGVTSKSRPSGTANLSRRAATWGGSFALEPRVEGGTQLTWTAPVEPPIEEKGA